MYTEPSLAQPGHAAERQDVGQPSACVCEVLLVFDKNIINDYNYSHYGQKETVSNCLCTGS
jgi:hypothetical protein